MTTWNTTRIQNLQDEIKYNVKRLENWKKAIAEGSEEDNFDIRFYLHNAGKIKQELKKLNSKLEKLQSSVNK